MHYREKQVEETLTREARLRGGDALKFISPGLAGVPDRIVILPGGVVCFVEVKRPGERPRWVQQVILRRLCRMGARTATVDNARSACRLVERLEKRYGYHPA